MIKNNNDKDTSLNNSSCGHKNCETSKVGYFQTCAKLEKL